MKSTQEITDEFTEKSLNQLEQTIKELKENNQKLQRQIQEQKAAENMLKKYEFIANSSKEFMTMIDRNYVYEAVNDAYCHAHNKKRSEFIGKTVPKVWGEEIFTTVLKNYLDQCFEGKEVRYQRWFNFTALGRRYFDVIYYPFYNNRAVTHTVVVTRDITDLKLMEERQRKLELELMKESRLSSIGLLAAGIAHNIRTPLTIIMCEASMVRKYRSEDETKKLIIKQAEKIDKILDTMMIKCRKGQESDATDLDLNELLTTELDFLETDHYFKHEIQKDYQFAESLPLIKGVYSDFSQGLINIIQNAIDSMYKSDKKVLKVKTYFDNEKIGIDISDTGCGIKKENLSKLFSPFFTTKLHYTDKKTDSPRGTGLGLFSSYQILKPYGVTIDVDSGINNGTTFRLKIPANKNLQDESSEK